MHQLTALPWLCGCLKIPLGMFKERGEVTIFMKHTRKGKGFNQGAIFQQGVNIVDLV